MPKFVQVAMDNDGYIVVLDDEGVLWVKVPNPDAFTAPWKRLGGYQDIDLKSAMLKEIEKDDQ